MYKFGDRVIGVKNSGYTEKDDEAFKDEDIVGKHGKIIATMHGDGDNIYCVVFDEDINNYNCIISGSRANRTTFVYENQIEFEEK